MSPDAILNYVVTNGVSLVIKLAASLAIWIVGRRIISILMGVVNRGIVRGGKIDATTSHYITSILSVLLTIGLVLGIFGYLGVQTTSFAALLAGAGIAIGARWNRVDRDFRCGRCRAGCDLSRVDRVKLNPCVIVSRGCESLLNHRGSIRGAVL